MLPPIIAGTLFSRPYKVQTKTEISSFRAKDYSCPCIGYTFSRAFFLIHVFPRFLHDTCFSALGACSMLSRAFFPIHVFLRFLPTFSRSCRMSFLDDDFPLQRRLHDFPRLIPLTQFPALTAVHVLLEEFAAWGPSLRLLWFELKSALPN